MNWRLTATASAEADLAEASAWYERQRPGLGGSFLDEARRTAALLTENPMQFQALERDAWRAPLRRFPYALVYRLIADEVRIVAVFHLRRHPRRWRQRL